MYAAKGLDLHGLHKAGKKGSDFSRYQVGSKMKVCQQYNDFVLYSFSGKNKSTGREFKRYEIHKVTRKGRGASCKTYIVDTLLQTNKYITAARYMNYLRYVYPPTPQQQDMIRKYQDRYDKRQKKNGNYWYALKPLRSNQTTTAKPRGRRKAQSAGELFE